MIISFRVHNCCTMNSLSYERNGTSTATYLGENIVSAHQFIFYKEEIEDRVNHAVITLKKTPHNPFPITTLSKVI